MTWIWPRGHFTAIDEVRVESRRAARGPFEERWLRNANFGTLGGTAAASGRVCVGQGSTAMRAHTIDGSSPLRQTMAMEGLRVLIVDGHAGSLNDARFYLRNLLKAQVDGLCFHL